MDRFSNFPDEFKRSLKISTIYALVGGIWILFSDKILEYYFHDAKMLSVFQTVKGWGFVLATSILLFILISRNLKSIKRIDIRCRALFESSSDIIFLHDMEGRIQEANDVASQSLGYNKDEFLKLQTSHIHPSEYEDNFSICIAELRQFGYRFWETNLIRKDGSIIPVDVSSRIIDYDGGEAVLNIVRDISERKRTKEALEESEARYRQVLEGMIEGAQIIGFDWRYLFLNDAAAKHGQRKREELLGHTMMEMYPGIEETVLFSEMQRCMQERVSLYMENEFTFPDGSKGWFYLRLHPVPEGIFILSIDITEQKLMEEKLLENQRRLLTLMNNLPGMAYRCRNDPDWTMEFVSRGCYTLTGYKTKELVGNRQVAYGELIHPEDSQMVWDGVQEALRNKRNFQLTYRIATANGEEKWVWEQGQGIYSAGNDVVALEGFITDISERVLAERLLRKSEARYRNIFDTTAVAIWEEDFSAVKSALDRLSPRELENIEHYLDEHPEFVDQAAQLIEVRNVNDETLRMFGATNKEELLGALEKVTTPETAEIIKGEIIAIAKGRTYFEGETFNRTIGGEQLDVLLTMTMPADAEYLDCVLVSMMDITKLKRAERELRRSAKQFSALYKTAHDLAGQVDLSSLLKMIVKRARKLFDTNVGGIYLYNAEKDELEMAAVKGYDIPIGTRLKSGEGMAGQVAQSRQPLVVKDYRYWQGRSQQYDQIPFTSVLQVPMLYWGELVGVLAVNEIAPKMRDFSKADIQLLSLFAASAAGAVRSARFHKSAQRRLEQLSSLRKIDKFIIDVLDPDITYTVILEEVLNQLHVDAACVLLLDSDLIILEYGASQGFRTDSLRYTSLKLGEGFAGKAALERRTIYVENLNAQDTGFLLSPHFKDEDFVAYIGIPLIVKGQVMGVLEIFHRDEISPDQEWLDFLDTLAGQFAIAIDNINMYKGLQQANTNLSEAYDSTLEGWARALEFRDMETEGHSRRVTNMAVALARSMGIGEESIVHIRRGALLHDIGKMAIPDSILRKTEQLNDEEWALMRQHPVYANELISKIKYLRQASDIPHYHHEKWDGSGYPHGLKGEQIPLAARIFAVVDVWDALSSDRPYRDAWSEKKVLDYIKTQAGKYFDPEVVEAFLELLKKGSI